MTVLIGIEFLDKKVDLWYKNISTNYALCTKNRIVKLNAQYYCVYFSIINYYKKGVI